MQVLELVDRSHPVAVGRLALRLALVFARLAFRAADARARVPAAFLAVVLRFVAAVRRLVVCVVAMYPAYPLHNVPNVRSSACSQLRTWVDIISVSGH